MHSFLSASALAELAAVEEIMRRKAAAAAQRGDAEMVEGSAVELGMLVGSERDMAQSLVEPAQYSQADTASSHETGDIDFPQEVTCAVCLVSYYCCNATLVASMIFWWYPWTADSGPVATSGALLWL